MINQLRFWFVLFLFFRILTERFNIGLDKVKPQKILRVYRLKVRVLEKKKIKEIES